MRKVVKWVISNNSARQRRVCETQTMHVSIPTDICHLIYKNLSFLTRRRLLKRVAVKTSKAPVDSEDDIYVRSDTGSRNWAR